MPRADSLPFLRIPPFPRHRGLALARPADGATARVDDLEELATLMTQARVGGTFWGAQPALPPGRDVLLAANSVDQAKALFAQAKQSGVQDRAVFVGGHFGVSSVPVISGQSDPWHLAAAASQVFAGADNELALVAALCGKPLHLSGSGRFAGLDTAPGALAQIIERELLSAWAWFNPFTGEPVSAAQTIAQLADWRGLIDGNRQAAAIFGVARWKRITADAMLWDGRLPLRYASPRGQRASALAPGSKALAWKSRTEAGLDQRLSARGVMLGEIEDGMIRSSGLGANCVPPLSIIVDFQGAHFDPAQASGLETILASADIGPELCDRSAALRRHLVAAGVSKYGQDSRKLVRPAGERRRVLVTGQVEDDRSVLSGGCGVTNLDLIRRARKQEGDAWLIYKPHPDVEAGHRKGHVPDAEALRFADEIERSASIAALIGSVDAVHVITSLAGFEALMHDKQVTTHGVPFYAGWGLTRDLGAVPDRRGRRRTLDELVAATLLLYPRYIDPVSRLPCPAEIVVERLAKGEARITSPLVRLREAQGRLNLLFKRLTRES